MGGGRTATPRASSASLCRAGEDQRPKRQRPGVVQVDRSASPWHSDLHSRRHGALRGRRHSPARSSSSTFRKLCIRIHSVSTLRAFRQANNRRRSIASTDDQIQRARRAQPVGHAIGHSEPIGDRTERPSPVQGLAVSRSGFDRSSVWIMMSLCLRRLLVFESSDRSQLAGSLATVAIASLGGPLPAAGAAVAQVVKHAQARYDAGAPARDLRRHVTAEIRRWAEGEQLDRGGCQPWVGTSVARLNFLYGWRGAGSRRLSWSR